MENNRFDTLAKAVAEAASRRSLLQGLAAIAGGAGLALFGVTRGDAFQAKARKKKGKGKGKGKKKKGCSRDAQCKNPGNPCKQRVCKNRKCQLGNRPDGTECGEGLVCFNGICGEGCDPSGEPCSGGNTCCESVCVDTDISFDNCGACDAGCDSGTADDCVGGDCVCGSEPECTGGDACCSSDCVDLDVSFDNCGGCGDDCDPALADACVDGDCVCGAGPACTGDLECVSGQCVVQVTPSDLNGWAIGANGEVEFVTGPAVPPLGTGSVRISTIDVTRSTIGNASYNELPIADLESLSYSTYMEDGSPTGVVVPAIKLPVRYDNDTKFTTLVFEPTYSLNSDVLPDVWQSWDALSSDARWWSSRAIPEGNPVICAFDCFVSWNDVLAAIPDAFITGALLIETGSGTDDADGNVDALEVNGVTFNFDPDA